MKIISFSAVEILPALLNKTKTQTIRPLKSIMTQIQKFRYDYQKNFDESPEQIYISEEDFHNLLQQEEDYNQYIGSQDFKTIFGMEIIKGLYDGGTITLAGKHATRHYKIHKLRFKIGDKVKMLWKQRSKYKWVCKKCGSPIVDFPYVCSNDNCDDTQGSYNLEKIAFPKLLGTGTITKVFQIEMGRNYIIMNGVWLSIYDCEQIAKLDGFKTVDDFFHYFNKHYDLSTLKRFAVYRWRWDGI